MTPSVEELRAAADIGVKNDHHRHGVNYLEVAGTRVGIAQKPDPRRGRSNSAPHWQAA